MDLVWRIANVQWRHNSCMIAQVVSIMVTHSSSIVTRCSISFLCPFGSLLSFSPHRDDKLLGNKGLLLSVSPHRDDGLLGNKG